MGRSSSPNGSKYFFFSTSLRPALGPTQTPIQWVPGILSLGVKRSGRKLTTHLQLVPRSRKRGSVFKAKETLSYQHLFLLSLHVSTLILGHHQASYSDKKI
jgi:hypothetical protein